MTPNIIVKVNRNTLGSIRKGERKTVRLPANPHWTRKLRNPATGRYYSGLRIIVRSYEKDPPFVISAKGVAITAEGNSYTIELTEVHVLLPPFQHRLINEPRRNSIR